MALSAIIKPFSAQEIPSRYCRKPYVEIQSPEWVKNATIYELNVRQLSPEGNFKAIEKKLPRL